MNPTQQLAHCDQHANHHSRAGQIEEVSRTAAGPTLSGIALRDVEYHLERAAQCMRAAVAADPCLAMKLGTVHTSLQDLQALLLECT